MTHKARRIAAAALLGLPAALTAHALLFGHDHQAGGSLHGLALASSLVAAFFAVAIRLRVSAGRFPSVTLAGAAWFAVIELCEHPHAISILPAALALIVAAVLTRVAVFFATSSIRAIAGALRGVQVRRGNDGPVIALRRETPAHLTITAHPYALFSRPPPLLS